MCASPVSPAPGGLPRPTPRGGLGVRSLRGSRVMGSGMNKEAYDLVRYDHAFRVPKRAVKRRRQVGRRREARRAALFREARRVRARVLARLMSHAIAGGRGHNRVPKYCKRSRGATHDASGYAGEGDVGVTPADSRVGQAYRLFSPGIDRNVQARNPRVQEGTAIGAWLSMQQQTSTCRRCRRARQRRRS